MEPSDKSPKNDGPSALDSEFETGTWDGPTKIVATDDQTQSMVSEIMGYLSNTRVAIDSLRTYDPETGNGMALLHASKFGKRSLESVISCMRMLQNETIREKMLLLLQPVKSEFESLELQKSNLRRVYLRSKIPQKDLERKLWSREEMAFVDAVALVSSCRQREEEVDGEFVKLYSDDEPEDAEDLSTPRDTFHLPEDTERGQTDDLDSPADPQQ